MYLGLTIISFVVFIAYVIYAVIKMQDTPFKIPHSISQTYYYVPWKGGMSTTYQIMIVTMLPVLIIMDAWFWWAKLAGILCMVCLWGVAGAPNYWDEKEKNVHNYLTYACEATAGIYGILATNFWWIIPIYAAIFLSACFITKTWEDCRSFWLELICFFSFYTMTILQLAV